VQEQVFLVKAASVREAFKNIYSAATQVVLAGPIEVVLRRPKRTVSQNSKMWPMLADVARQKQLVINGVLVWAKPEDWKDVFTAALKREQRMAMGIDGGLVVLGMRTSRMRKKEFSDLIELIYAYGSENGIAWSEPALRAYESYREAA